MELVLDEIGRDWVRQRIRNELITRGWNVADLAREAGVDAGTVGDFLSGNRWPQFATQKRVAVALGWRPESVQRMEKYGGEPITEETVGPFDQDDGVLLSMPPEALEGLGPAEREEVIAAARLSALRAAREIRRRLDEEQDR